MRVNMNKTKVMISAERQKPLQKLQDGRVVCGKGVGRNGQGAKGPGSELAAVLLADSLLGANWPGSEKAWYRYKIRGTH